MNRLADFDYDLPAELIAQSPLNKRTESRLLVLKRDDEYPSHSQFQEVISLLRPNDALVINKSMVMKARIFGNKKNTGGAVEILLVRPQEDQSWICLVRAKGKKLGMEIQLTDTCARVRGASESEPGAFIVEFDGDIEEIIESQGELPLPTYITRKAERNDLSRYQTVYADSNLKRSVAAPTAGLHFDEELLKKIRDLGVTIIPVVLHVGPGTFAPVRHEDISLHQMHTELAELSEESARQINETKQKGGRIVCVGTTSVRVLESFANNDGFVQAGRKMTRIFITPGYEFKVTDALITNFHLPKSTLLMLVSAFAGCERVLRAYKEAIEKKYRFFSYGDACFFEKWKCL